MKHVRKILLTLLLIPLFGNFQSIAQNLIINGGFENDLSNWFTQAGTGTTASFNVITSDVKEGAKALQVNVVTPGANAWNVQAINDAWASEADKSYTLTFWAKSAAAGSSFKAIMQLDPFYAERVFTLTDTWQQYSWTFTAGVNNLQLKMHFPTAGVFYFDGFNIPAPSVQNELITNGGFEAGSGNSFTDWWSAAGGGSTAAITATNDVADGSRALKVEVTTPGANPWDVQVVNNVPWASITGQSYTLSLWAKAATAGSSFKIVQQKDPAYAEKVISLTTTWQKYEWTFTSQADGLSLKFHFPNAGTFFIDKISIPGSSGNEPIPPFDPSGLSPIAQGLPKFLGSAHSQSQSPFFKNYWNQVTPENGGKWGSVEATRDVMNWAQVDSAYNLAKRNGFAFRYHVMVWGNQQPTWIENLPPSEQLEEIKEWFAAVAARYPDIDYLEVVNEPLHDVPNAGSGNYIDALGGNGSTGWDWILTSFRMAREYFPSKTKLMLNEYSITNDQSSAQRYINIINLLKAENLIDVIGVQGHAFSTRVPVATTKSNLDLLASTGLPIMVTEMDIDGPTDQIQLTDYKTIFPIFWEHPSVVGITMWGWRPGLWRDAQKANLVMSNGGEKPAMKWLRAYVTNKKPVVTAGQTLNLSESATNGFVLGSVEATDIDTNTVLKGWQITGGTGAAIFAIDTTGKISLIDNTLIDFETTPSYTLLITVNDGYTNSAAETVTINVINENDNTPTVAITSPADGFKINKGESLEVTASANDADGDLANVSLTINDALVRVDSNAPYQWGGSLNDALLKSLMAGIYTITATAKDNGGKQATSSITITVLDDIIGPDCGVRNGVAVFELNPKYLHGAGKINWWFNGYTKSIKPLTPNNSKVEVSFGQWFNPGSLHVGINYKKAPYYLEFKRSLVLCESSEPEPQALVVSPNPTNGPITISAGRKLSEVQVMNSSGKVVIKKKNINTNSTDLVLGGNLPSGIYKVVVYYPDGTMEFKTVSLQR